MGSSQVNQFAKKTVVTAAMVGSVFAMGGQAYASSSADGAAVDSPGVLSGNLVQVPVHIPVNLCGNSVNVIAALNPTFGNTCVNAEGPMKPPPPMTPPHHEPPHHNPPACPPDEKPPVKPPHHEPPACPPHDEKPPVKPPHHEPPVTPPHHEPPACAPKDHDDKWQGHEDKWKGHEEDCDCPEVTVLHETADEVQV
ncbi:chaplin [Yinghuangia seranimata]|uniref:chaplin n=1 Tax=Yinghuangia seranimata TaxID=408067 RepID=UPI00248A92BC|nr:chaplin family protein [Yinghuangia seranimata]MDI2126045.1 chaplin family protein [Yinghuangia seranimata]